MFSADEVAGNACRVVRFLVCSKDWREGQRWSGAAERLGSWERTMTPDGCDGVLVGLRCGR